MSAVNAILAEAVDLIALEQIAKLNTAHVADNSALPSSLEPCFCKLKSLPAAPFAAAPVRILDRSVAEKKGDSSPPLPQQPVRPPATIPATHGDDDDEDLERLFGSGRRGRPMLWEWNRGRDDGGGGSPSPPPPRQACCFGFSPRKPLQRTPRKE
ncbi:hypothetical protein SETIT_1G309500v2 [Setaria italica]|nr:hypothetical protein SETIT_1G309500v2 [Setaria italica]